MSFDNREYNRRWREAHVEHRREYMRRWRKRNREAVRESNQAFQKSPKGRFSAINRVSRREGYTPLACTQEEFLRWYEKQDLTLCQMCGCFTNKPQIDHCHKTGRLRGIVCIRCNLVLGHYENELLRMQAQSYLLSH